MAPQTETGTNAQEKTKNQKITKTIDINNKTRKHRQTQEQHNNKTQTTNKNTQQTSKHNKQTLAPQTETGTKHSFKHMRICCTL